MNNDPNEWSKQASANFTEKEFLRYGCALIAILIIGIALGMVFHNAGIIIIFVVAFHGIIWLAPYWQPAYGIVHKIMGNPNIPSALPKSQRKWWHYIPIA